MSGCKVSDPNDFQVAVEAFMDRYNKKLHPLRIAMAITNKKCIRYHMLLVRRRCNLCMSQDFCLPEESRPCGINKFAVHRHYDSYRVFCYLDTYTGNLFGAKPTRYGMRDSTVLFGNILNSNYEALDAWLQQH